MPKAINDCTTLDELVDVYVNWCEKHGYTSMSADELHYELLAIEPRRDKHIKWLEAYIKRWEMVTHTVVEDKKPSIKVEEHWKSELTKLRCWLTGFKTGRGNDFPNAIPGEDVLRQICQAISEVTSK